MNLYFPIRGTDTPEIDSAKVVAFREAQDDNQGTTIVCAGMTPITVNVPIMQFSTALEQARITDLRGSD